mmetsp:Transcript_8294/g.14483  ORF Transcript_8294/g.14483 Transcript_8294/m.14483 type:complete len:1266 (+) Transcript_8294:77-3874(+)
MALLWHRAAASIMWLLVLTCFSPELCVANMNSSTSSLAQCNSATGLKSFILPMIDKGHRSPESHIPYGVMADLFFRRQFDSSVRDILDYPEEYYKMPDLDPCLRVEIKLVPDHDNARDAFINSEPYFYYEYDDSQKRVRTHTAMYGADNDIHSYAGMEADALGIIHVSNNIMPVVGDQNLFPNFFRASPSTLYQLHPIRGFFTMYDWKSVIVLYSTDSRGVAFFEAFMDNAAKDSIASKLIRGAPLTFLMPLPESAIRSQLGSLRPLPIRVIFHFVVYGAEHKAMQGTSFVDDIMKFQMEIGLWLPSPNSPDAYQIVSGSDFIKADYFQSAVVRAMMGTSSNGSFFFSESNLKEPSVLAARWPLRSWWLGKAGQLSAVDLNLPQVQKQYGLNAWPSSVLQPVLQRFNNENGLMGWLLSSQAENIDASWLKADMAMKQMMAHNCFLHRGGNFTMRDPRLFGDCLKSVSQEKKLFTIQEAFDVDRMMEDYHYLFGPVQVLDPIKNVSVSFWWNEVVHTEAGHGSDRFSNGFSKAGRFRGHEAPVWGNGVQSDDPPETLLNCTPGMRYSLDGMCLWCQAGRYTNIVDAVDCTMCPEGRFVEVAGATTCYECAPGSEARDKGSQRCDSCKPGSYSNKFASSSCTSCQIGAFSDAQGATACKNCGAGNTTENIAAGSSSDCVCPRGQYLSADYECVECMEGLACTDGWPSNWATKGGTPVLKQEFYSLKSAPYDTYRCQQKGSIDDHPRCPGGPPERCSDGLDKDTLVCAKCSKSGYHIVNGSCEKCPAYLKVLLLFIIIAGILLIVMFFYLSNAPLAVNAGHKQDFAIFVGLVVTVLQIFGVLKQLQIQWPMEMGSFLGSSSEIFTFRFSFSCAVGDSAIAQYFTQALIPYFLIAMTAVLGIASKFVARAFEKEWMAWSLSKCLNVVGQVLQALFIAFCDIMARPMRCYDHPNGKQSLVDFPEVVCWESREHIFLVIIAAGIFLFFILPYVSWCVWGCLKAPSKTFQKDTAFLESFRFLFYRFRPDCWWWGLVFLVRQTCLAFAAVVPSSNAHAQLFYTGGILMIYGYFLSMFWPWISTELSIVDFGTCLVLILLLLCSSQFLPVAAEAGRVSLVVALLMVLGSVVFRYLVIFMISFCSNGLDEEVCGEMPNRLDLCQQWFEFLDGMQNHNNQETIETMCKMNTFDRTRILAVMHTWTANGKQGFSGKKTPPRLCNIRSRTSLNEEAIGNVNMRVSAATDSRNLGSYRATDSSNSESLMPVDATNSHEK